MKKYLLLTASILICGCMNDSSDQKSNTGNEEVNCLQINYGISDLELIERVSKKDRATDLTLLKKVRLPKNASLCEKRDFIDAILYLSSNQRNYMETDPQVTMIAVALKGNEEDFLSMAKPNWHSPNSYISDAYIKILSKPEMKGFVKKHFPKHQWLIEVVTNNGWSKEFKKEIIEYAEENNGHVNYHFATAFRQINDPATKELILKSLINSEGNRHIFYSRIKQIDWLDITPTLMKLWQSPDVSELELEYLAYPLGVTGFIPVLEYLANKENGSTYNNPYRKNIDFFNFLTEQELEPNEMKEWLKSNRDSLYFDADSRKIKVGKVNHTQFDGEF